MREFPELVFFYDWFWKARFFKIETNFQNWATRIFSTLPISFYFLNKKKKTDIEFKFFFLAGRNNLPKCSQVFGRFSIEFHFRSISMVLNLIGRFAIWIMNFATNTPRYSTRNLKKKLWKSPNFFTPKTPANCSHENNWKKIDTHFVRNSKLWRPKRTENSTNSKLKLYFTVDWA